MDQLGQLKLGDPQFRWELTSMMLDMIDQETEDITEDNA
jgi:hypothetical protein